MYRSRKERLEEEWFMVRHSGEIPEIALHSAFYSLTEDPEEPRLQLSAEEIQYLQEAAAARYQEIILRDLCYDNRELTIYRGVRRAICNWHRFVVFCERQKSACPNLRRTTREAFLLLVNKVLHATGKAIPIPVFNCSFHDITLFAHELGISEEQLPEDISRFCDE